MRTNRLVTTAAALALTGLLTACGSMQPGVAAKVGDDTFTTDRVDTLTTDFCEAVTPLLQQQDRREPMSMIRLTALSSLLVESIGRGVAAQYGVEAGPGYQQAMQGIRAQAAEMDDAAAEAFTEVNEAGAYFQDVMLQAAQKSLAERGVENPAPEEVNQQVDELLAAWVKEHGVDIDPRYGLVVQDGQLRQADTGLSVATSDVASRLVSGEYDPEWVASLPSTQRCG